MEYVLSELCEQVMTARASHKPLFISGGGSKRFYGNYRPLLPQDGHCLLDITPYRGIVNYQPAELVVTARAGTRLAELEEVLAREGQMLPFEPPRFGPTATLGGCVAVGLAGPRRMSAGGVRDAVLGARLLDAHGHLLAFGGEVIKNVAGYDVPRLLAGSMGIFGAIVEVSLKVVPRPFAELTLRQPATQADALRAFAAWRARPLPVSAACWVPQRGSGPNDPDADAEAEAEAEVGDLAARPGSRNAHAYPYGGVPGAQEGDLWVRLSGAPGALEAGWRHIGGERVDGAEAMAHWESLREQSHPYFCRQRALWRVAVPPATPPLPLGVPLIEWGGGQRWVRGPLCADSVRRTAQNFGGHATLFRAALPSDVPADGVFHPLTRGAAMLTRRLKQELDPAGIFNPGRLSPEL